MNFTDKIQTDLGIGKQNSKVVFENLITCLIPTKWLHDLQTQKCVPSGLSKYGELSPDAYQQISYQNESYKIPGYRKVMIQGIAKNKKKVNSLPKSSHKITSNATFSDLNYFQLIHYVTETNYKNLWKQAYNKYCLSEGHSNKNQDSQCFNSVIRNIIKRMYNCSIIKIGDTPSLNPSPGHCSTPQMSCQKDAPHSNLAELLCAVESETFFYLIYEKPTYTLHHCVLFSPAILDTSTIRKLFIVYQLLHVLRSVHNSGLYVGGITLNHIFLEENLWIKVFPAIFHELVYNKEADSSSQMLTTMPMIALDKTISNAPTTLVETVSEIEDKNRKLCSLTESWVQGMISNYDYLLALNKLAGRMKDNPQCHPIMPWIMNFSVIEGGWRDLSKSKFRLNKGDKQLDLIYESASVPGNTTVHGNIANILQSSAVMVPHHTSDVLTDITYYVYKARKLPKSVLCQHVRPKWVPAEYPSTIERLQEWTPDECIPEFFSDPSIFYSIHSDLPDLGVPSWSDGPQDFIKKHRSALESEHVSERLHQWIDITFGYRLSGSAAMKSKNVCLPLVDLHTSIRNHGMVQLFNHPHPHKISNSLYFGSAAPKTFRNVAAKSHDAKDSGEDETSSESSGKPARWKVLRSKSMPAGPEQLRSETRPENLTIVLPKDYIPMSSLKQLESFYTFLARTQGGRIPDSKTKTFSESSSDQHNQSKDMIVLGFLISEMSLSSHLRLVPNNITLEERYEIVCKLLKHHRNQIPKCLSQVIQLLLQLSLSFEPESSTVKDGKYSMPSRYSPVSFRGLPPPSPHQLLQTLIHIIPFPSYFGDLYVFLGKLSEYSKRLQDAVDTEPEGASKNSIVSDIAKSWVQYTAETFHSLLPRLSAEAIELITPYIQEMFENVHTSLHASWLLFNTFSQCLGPQQSARKLLKSLIKIFDLDTPSSKHMKMYHRTFLLQLIVRFGLLNFLAHFMTVLIEAVGGLKDYLPMDLDGSQDCYSSDNSSKRKSSHLQSPELQHMAEESERSLNDSNVKNVHIYNDDASQADGHYIDGDEDKDAEMFDFDENSEGSAKVPSISEALSSSSNILPIITQDDYNDDYDNEGHLAEYDHKDNDEDPDVIDALASPFTEPQKISKPSIYSRSAPNPTSYLSHYIPSQTNDIQQPSKDSDGILPQEAASSSALSPSSIKNDGNLNISDVAAESVLWLSHRLGPVLTARYLTRNLLRMLTLCYDGPEKKEIISEIPQYMEDKSCVSISRTWYAGDRHALKVLDCLSQISALYGEQFIILQYLPHIADLLILCKKRVSAALESGLIGAMALLQHIIPYLSDATLMDYLQDVIIKDILFLVVRLISSQRLNFPSGGDSRLIVTCRLMDIIYIIGLRIGFEMTRKNLSGILQRFFSCFDKVYEPNGDFKSLGDSSGGSAPSNSPLQEQALEEMRQAFTPEVAYISYIPFCKLAGGIFMEQTLKNDELIRNLCLRHDLNMTENAPTDLSDGTGGNGIGAAFKTHHRRGPSLGQDDCFVSGVFGKNVAVVGNRLDVQLGEESHMVAPLGDPVPNASTSSTGNVADVLKYDISLLRRKMDNNQRHLKGNWLAYWEHEKGRSEKDDHFNFKQIKLQSFIGHKDAIRTIHVLDNENSFLTSSKDKTVKLWSLRSFGDGTGLSPCQWTYSQHRKSVFAVSFLESLRVVGSCDTTVHIWDPYMGSCIKQVEPIKGSPITVLASMPAPSTSFLAATSNSTVRFLDARTCSYMHEFKVSTGATGLIRCLAVSPNGYWLAVGHSTGMISVLDVRTGLLFGSWMGHEGEVLQLKAFNNSYFVTSSLDHSMSVWSSEDSHPKCHLKGPMEPVISLCFYKGEVISGTSGNKIGLHTSIDRKACYSSTRLRSDALMKSTLTAMALLPLNRLLLVGAENGNVILLS